VETQLPSALIEKKPARFCTQITTASPLQEMKAMHPVMTKTKCEKKKIKL